MIKKVDEMKMFRMRLLLVPLSALLLIHFIGKFEYSTQRTAYTGKAALAKWSKLE